MKIHIHFEPFLWTLIRCNWIPHNLRKPKLILYENDPFVLHRPLLFETVPTTSKDRVTFYISVEKRKRIQWATYQPSSFRSSFWLLLNFRTSSPRVTMTSERKCVQRRVTWRCNGGKTVQRRKNATAWPPTPAWPVWILAFRRQCDARWPAGTTTAPSRLCVGIAVGRTTTPTTAVKPVFWTGSGGWRRHRQEATKSPKLP